MSLIKSISGIRGTIGGAPGDNLTPLDTVKFAAAYGTWLKSQTEAKKHKVVVGRDGRMSGELVKSLVVSTLTALGIDVIDVDLSTTPTVEMAVKFFEADGGIIITASHNPKEWNALKLLNKDGEFLDGDEGAKIIGISENDSYEFVPVDKLGKVTKEDGALAKHIESIVNYPLVDVEAIRAANFNIVADVINSSGAIALPKLFEALGVENYKLIFDELTGDFAHNPEPLPENLATLSNTVVKNGASMGISVDPDVDRLCFVCEDGSMFGEEYTLVAVADYVTSQRPGNTVSNMSSTKSLKELTVAKGAKHFASAVGEVNVVKKMKAENAVIGGEGNGGIIIPDLHYGRDALIGIALFLTHLAKANTSVKKLRNKYPDYFISKNKIQLNKEVDVKSIFDKLMEKYKNNPINTEDGLKIEFDNDWVHMRTSNTEPIIRIYSESNHETTANNIANRIVKDIQEAM